MVRVTIRRIKKRLCLLTIICICVFNLIQFNLIKYLIPNGNISSDLTQHTTGFDIVTNEFRHSHPKHDAYEPGIVSVHDVNVHVNEDLGKDVTPYVSNGSAVYIKEATNPVEQLDDSFYNINRTVSDLTDIRRILPDGRNEACQRKVYPSNLPKASVVIIFRDEWPSVLIRTVYSALNNTPPSLLREIILVDDGSLDYNLRVQIKSHFYDITKVKLLTNLKPLGLMMARQRGIETTLSEYFIIMDCHMEFSKGWLEPLLYRLLENPRSLLSANIGHIDENTFEVKFSKKDGLGHFITFDPLTLGQLWAGYSSAFKHQRNHSFDPVPIGAVQGMFIAMKKDFFMELGGFDPGMKQWGSEQFELSFKVWMCGGVVENVPCSHVAHMFRHTPWGSAKSTDNFLAANKIRTSEVWMDEPHKSFIREVNGQHSQFNIGDLTHRHRIRKENNCHNFQYFLDKLNSFSDVYVLDNIKAKGEIRSKKRNKCLQVERDKHKVNHLEIHTCNNSSKQYFILTEQNQVRSIKGHVLKAVTDKSGESMKVTIHSSPSRQYIEHAVWQHRNDNSLYHTATKKCLTVVHTNVFRVETCNGSPEQQWFWHRL